jgi:hypothetical protein
MKKKLILISAFNILLFNTLLAQNGLYTYDLPTGYTPIQLNFRNAIYTDTNGDVWAGFKQIGLGRFDGNSWQMFNTGNSCLPSNEVLSLGKYGSAIVVGTSNGLVLLNTNCVLFNTSNSGIPGNSINCIAVYAGLLCVGTNSGIGVYNGSTWTVLNQANSGLVNDTIQAIHYSGNGLLACTKGGVAKLNGSTWINSTGLTLKNATSVALDQLGRYWIQTILGDVFMLMNNSIILPSSQYPELAPDMLNKCGYLVNNQQNEVYLISMPAIYKINSTVTSFYYPINPFTGNGTIASISNDNLWLLRKSNDPNLKIYNIKFNQYLPVLTANNITTAENLKFLDINKIKAAFTTTAISHWNFNDNVSYEIPKGQGKSTMHMSNFWMIGKANTENFWRGSNDRYSNQLIHLPGPLRLSDGLTDSSMAIQFEKIWKVNRFDVENFIAQFNAGNVQNGSYTIPEPILAWPGNGPAGYDQQLAPFVDVNNDAIYNPYDGDYPKIKGDQMLWWVLNDQLTANLDSHQTHLGLEVRVSAYAYVNNSTTTSDSIINFITFLQYEFINRSTNHYDSLFIGFNSDCDIDYAWDDYVGSCVNRSFYFYNGPPFDTSGGSNSWGNYHQCPPTQTVTLLKDPVNNSAQNSKLNGFTYYNNSTGLQGNPTNNIMDYVNYLSGRWKDGSPLVYGGKGYSGSNGATNIPAKFLLPHNSDVNFSNTGGINPGFYWSELLPAPGLPSNEPFDKRGIGRLGPYTFAPGEKKTMELAFVTHFWPCTDAINLRMEKTCAFNQQLISWYDNNNFPTGLDLSNVSLPNENKQDGFLYVFPNPFSQSFNVSFKTEQNSRFGIRILDISGREIMKSGKNNNESDGSNIQIDASGLANGIYFVEVFNHQKSERKMIVKTGN